MTSVSNSVERHLGYRAEELVGRPFQDLNLIVPESLEAAVNDALQVLAGNTVIATEYVFSRRDGSTAIGEVSGSPLVEDGKVIGLISIARDITERRRMEEALLDSHAKLARNFKGSIDVISETIERKGPYAPGHHRRVAALTSAIAQEMRLTDFQVQGIGLAAAVYDIGLIDIPIEFLQDTDRLDGIKLTMYRGYPQTGHDALKKLEFLWPIADIILQHRECFDGSGFPQGIKGETILIEARILAVVDALEDLTSNKIHRPALPMEEALAVIENHRDSKYDPYVINTCLKLFNEKGYKMEG